MYIFDNIAAKGLDHPSLSVLIPYYKDNPDKLLRALLLQLQSGSAVEILLYDDGTNDTAVNEGLQNIAKKSAGAIRLFFAKKNKGRSTARNTLQKYAKAKWVLFLDADMLPQTETFLADYLALVKENTADIIFGGFTVPSQRQSASTELHRAFSQTSDCLTANQRMQNGPQYVCSSNLCVRSSVLDAQGFDPSFTGWGWEDSEWAARVSKKYTLHHADIPALHLGLESTETLLSRFKNSAENYVKFTKAHPELAKTLTLYKMSNKLKHFPGQKLMRPFLALLVRTSFAPTQIRLTALKLWRASWYAEAFS